MEPIKCALNACLEFFVPKTRNHKYHSKKCKNLVLNNQRTSYYLRWRNIKHRYGLTKEEYYVLWCKQGKCCAVCKRKTSKKFQWCVDHSHDRTKRVRGILCWRCNTILGMSRDNTKILKQAIEYLNVSNEKVRSRSRPKRYWHRMRRGAGWKLVPSQRDEISREVQ